MRILDWMFPKEKDFYKMLEDQSEITLRGIKTFCQTMSEGPTPETIQLIFDIEHEGDQTRRILIDDLNRTFITPIEREDIFSLSRTVDDILDLSKSAIEEFQIYKLSPTEHIKAMLAKTRISVMLLHEAIVLLKDHPTISVEKCSAAKDTVDEAENIYYNALANLAESDDVKFMFKMREIYKHIFQLNNRIDDAANIILDIIVKTT